MEQGIYFETLGAALHSFIRSVQEEKFAIFDGGTDQVFNRFDGGIPYEQTRYGSFPLESIKGKTTRKYAHSTIYRMPSGRYELTHYVL